MKKIISLIICVLLIFSTKVAYGNTNEMIAYNGDYKLNFKSFNSDSLTFNDFYIDQSLSYYTLCQNLVYMGHKKSLGNLEWTNPNYIIKEGNQAINVTFTKADGRNIIFTVGIYGIYNPSITILQTTSLTMDIGTTYNLNLDYKLYGSKYIWESSNPNVAMINQSNGMVTAIDYGKSDITCEITSVDGDVSILTAKVEIPKVNQISLSDNQLLLSTDSRFSLWVNNSPMFSKNKWSCSNEGIIKVFSDTGKIISIKSGKATVFCTVTKGRTATILKCDVTVE